MVRDYSSVQRAARAARDAVSLGHAAAAREPLRRWLAARPSSAEAHALMAQVALADGDLGEVTRLMNQARSLGCPQAELERLQALVMARMGRFAEAEPILTRIWAEEAKADPSVADALTRMLLGSYRLGEARHVIDRWMRDVPADARPYLWLTEFDRRIEVDNPGSWEQHYREALRRDPGLDAARRGLAETLGHLHRNGEADAEYRRYLASHPDDPEALVGAGRNAVELGDLDRATELLDRALAVAPANIPALKGRADVDLHRDDAQSALRWLDRAIGADPFDHEALHVRRRPRPAGRPGRRPRRSRRVRPAQARSGRAAQARERILGEPGNSDLWARVAAWMFAHGRDQDGVGWAMAALARQPDHAPTCRLLADYYARRPDQAGLANFYRLKAEQEPAADPRGDR